MSYLSSAQKLRAAIARSRVATISSSILPFIGCDNIAFIFMPSPPR